MKSLSMDSLSMVLDSVKILYIQMNSFDLNKIIGLLQCFPCLEKLYVKVIISHTLELTIQLLLFRHSFLDLNYFKSSCLFRQWDGVRKL